MIFSTLNKHHIVCYDGEISDKESKFVAVLWRPKDSEWGLSEIYPREILTGEQLVEIGGYINELNSKRVGL